MLTTETHAFGFCQYIFLPSCASLEPRAPTETKNTNRGVSAFSQVQCNLIIIKQLAGDTVSRKHANGCILDSTLCCRVLRIEIRVNEVCMSCVYMLLWDCVYMNYLFVVVLVYFTFFGICVSMHRFFCVVQGQIKYNILALVLQPLWATYSKQPWAE